MAIVNAGVFLFSSALFDPGCSGNFNEDQTVFVIQCGVSNSSEPIQTATYTVNGVDMGSGEC